MRQRSARLELQLAQQNVAVFQSQFAEGKLNLREVEKARLGRERKVDGVSGCKFSETAGAVGIAKDGGAIG